MKIDGNTNNQPDVILVQPPYEGPYNFWKSENLGMGYLASSLESKGYSVEILDAFLLDMSIDEVVTKLAENPPRLLLGFSILSYQLYRTAQIVLMLIREKGINVHVTIGSWFPTFWSEHIVAENNSINSIVKGDGEIAITMLVDFLKVGKWEVGHEHMLQISNIRDVMVLSSISGPAELDMLPHPRRDYFNEVLKQYHLITSHTSRGCGHNSCTFCSVPAFYHNHESHRFRSAENVIEEIGLIPKDGGDFIFFTDEDFIGGTRQSQIRAADIFEGISSKSAKVRFAINCPVKEVDKKLFLRLKDSGLAAAYIGIESHQARYLRRFGKGVRPDEVDKTVNVLNELGVKIVPGWIMFERDTTFLEIKESLDYLRSIETYHVNYLKSLYVMKDTLMEKIYQKNLYKTFFYSKYFFKDPQVDLLVRIITNDYLPEVMPYTNAIYPIWHKLLGGFGTDQQQQEFNYINRTIRDLSFNFLEEVMGRIRLNSLDGLTHELSWQVTEWEKIAGKINELAFSLGH